MLNFYFSFWEIYITESSKYFWKSAIRINYVIQGCDLTLFNFYNSIFFLLISRLLTKKSSELVSTWDDTWFTKNLEMVWNMNFKNSGCKARINKGICVRMFHESYVIYRYSSWSSNKSIINFWGALTVSKV